MKVLLTGAGGQLGQALIASAPEGLELVATSRQQLDLADPEACRGAVEQHQPDWVLNAGAYTAVDKAESEPELAHAVNAGARRPSPALLINKGDACSRSAPTSSSTEPRERRINPSRPAILSVFTEQAKLLEKTRSIDFGAGGRGLILRTSWVIGPVGKNFALTMLGSTGNGINWVLSPIKWAVPPAPSTSLKPVGTPFRALVTANCQLSCTGVMPAPPAGTTWRWPLAKSVLTWGSSTRPQPFNRSPQRTTRHLLNGRPIPFLTAPPPEPPWTSAASTGSKL